MQHICAYEGNAGRVWWVCWSFGFLASGLELWLYSNVPAWACRNLKKCHASSRDICWHEVWMCSSFHVHLMLRVQPPNEEIVGLPIFFRTDTSCSNHHSWAGFMGADFEFHCLHRSITHGLHCPSEQREKTWEHSFFGTFLETWMFARFASCTHQWVMSIISLSRNEIICQERTLWDMKKWENAKHKQWKRNASRQGSLCLQCLRHQRLQVSAIDVHSRWASILVCRFSWL